MKFFPIQDDPIRRTIIYIICQEEYRIQTQTYQIKMVIYLTVREIFQRLTFADIQLINIKPSSTQIIKAF